MAPLYAQKASWLALLASLVSVQAQTRTRTASGSSSSSSKFWTYTSRMQDYVSSSAYTYGEGDTTTFFDTSTRDIKTGASPTETPYSISTEDSFYSYDDDLQIVYAYYSEGAVPEADLEPTTDYSYYLTATSTSDSIYTAFRMPVTYTAPASCPTPFTVSVDETVSVPSQVRDQVTPTSVSTGSVNTYYTYGADQTETWYLSEGAAPLETSTAYNYMYYVSDCSTPYSYPTGGGSNYYGGGDDSDDDYLSVCSWYSGCTSLKTWIIVIATILPTIFLLGFLESYIWFRRLMIGKSALRFGTICWGFLSIWIFCFTRAQSKRSAEDQKLLRENWKQTSAGQAFKLWLKWGFRRAYPVPLLGQYSRNTVGIVPEGQPLPQMGQTPGPVYGAGYQPPPGAPAAYYPNGMPQNGQPYYPPPQGWSPAPNGQGYPIPPPGQAYMPPQNGAGYYGEQHKQNTTVSDRAVSPPLPGPYPAPTSPASAPSPPANVAETPSPPHQPGAPYQPPPGTDGQTPRPT